MADMLCNRRTRGGRFLATFSYQDPPFLVHRAVVSWVEEGVFLAPYMFSDGEMQKWERWEAGWGN